MTGREAAVNGTAGAVVALRTAVVDTGAIRSPKLAEMKGIDAHDIFCCMLAMGGLFESLPHCSCAVKFAKGIWSVPFKPTGRCVRVESLLRIFFSGTALTLS